MNVSPTQEASHGEWKEDAHTPSDDASFRSLAESSRRRRRLRLRLRSKRKRATAPATRIAVTAKTPSAIPTAEATLRSWSPAGGAVAEEKLEVVGGDGVDRFAAGVPEAEAELEPDEAAGGMDGEEVEVEEEKEEVGEVGLRGGQG